jgi:Fe-S-cluster-containing hydrogenase component 2
VCPVHAIRIVAANEPPVVEHNRCIGCGACVRACADGAITYLESISQVRQLLQSNDKVAALVDPSISGEFPDITDYRKFVEMIRQLGFEVVADASFGVDLVARAYKNLFERARGKYYLMANCPAMVAFVSKFHPHLTDNLAPIVTPMEAMAGVMRQKFGKELRTVFIGPCIAAKASAGVDGDKGVDAVITFTELRALFQEHHIHESQLEYSDFDPPHGRLGSLYPISRGILEAGGISQNLIDGTALTAEGDPEALQAVASFSKNIDQIRRHFNIFYNRGCVMGPGMTGGGDKHLRDALVTGYSQRRMAGTDETAWQQAMEEFAALDLSRQYTPDDQRLPDPPQKRIDEVLALLGKSERNMATDACRECGFENCHAFAKAVAQGLTRTDMCQDFNIKNKNNYIATLRESTTRQTAELDKLKQELMELRANSELINDKLETSRAILNQIPSGVVIVDEKLKILSSNHSFIELLGDEAHEIDNIIPGLRGANLKTLVPVQFYKVFQNVLDTGQDILSRDVKIEEAFLNLSVFSIKHGKVAGGIVRDMFSPEVRNEQIIQRMTEVIDQNLEMVQQIGFLLGEGASKTEAMLNSIIQLHRKKKGESRS